MEFTENPDFILTSNFNYCSTEFMGFKIGEPLSNIINPDINECYDNDKTYQNHKIKNGWILLNNGIQFIIKDGLIQTVHIKQNGLGQMIKTDIKTVENRIGKADKISEDGVMWVTDYVVNNNIYHFLKRNTKFYFSVDNDKLSEIEIG